MTEETPSQPNHRIPTEAWEPPKQNSTNKEIASLSGTKEPQGSLEETWKLSMHEIGEFNACEKQRESRPRKKDEEAMRMIRLRRQREATMNQRITIKEAMKLVQLSKDRNESNRPCMNLIRGCDIDAFSSITSVHELSCPFNKAVKLRVMGKLNVFSATTKGFKPYCRSFEAKYDVSFMFKKCLHSENIKMWVGGWTKKYNYKINLFASTPPFSIIWSTSGPTHGDIEIVPAELIKKHGNLIKYEVKLGK